MAGNSAPIGVFDSGMGGLSVLRALRAAMPHERLIYYGDNENAPYGTRTPQEICALSLQAAQLLMQKGVKALGHRGGQIRAGDVATSVATRGGFSGLISKRSALLLPFLNLLEAVRGVIRL